MTMLFWTAGLILAAVFIFRLLRYLSTPLLRSMGFYKYYSPMFCTMPFINNQLDIHLGTSWDFFRAGKLTPRKILLYLAEGLYNLNKAIQNGEVDGNKMLRGNVFYLKRETFEKFGFTARKLNTFEFILFLLNYIELCILQSISMRKLTFISFRNLTILTIKAKDLNNYSMRLESVFNQLKKERPEIKTAEKRVKKSQILQPENVELVLND